MKKRGDRRGEGKKGEKREREKEKEKRGRQREKSQELKRCYVHSYCLCCYSNVIKDPILSYTVITVTEIEVNSFNDTSVLFKLHSNSSESVVSHRLPWEMHINQL